MSEALDELLPHGRPGPDSITHELGEMPFEEAAAPEPDLHEPLRELARADAEKKIRRMAPTKLSDEEKEVYLQAFDAHRTAMAE